MLFDNEPDDSTVTVSTAVFGVWQTTIHVANGSDVYFREHKIRGERCLLLGRFFGRTLLTRNSAGALARALQEFADNGRIADDYRTAHPLGNED